MKNRIENHNPYSTNFFVFSRGKGNMIKVKNTTNQIKTIYVVTRDQVQLDPGEEIEFDGDIELVEE